MEKRPRGKSVAVSRWNRKIDSKRMVAVRGLFVDRNWNRKFSNTRYDFDLYGGIANRSPCAKHGVPDARHGLSLRTKYSVACAYTEYILSRVPCIICYWWIISPSVFHECLSNETRYVCFRVRRALRNIPWFFAKTPRLPFFNQNYNRFEIIPRSSSNRSILIQVRFITNRNFNRDFTSTVMFARNYLFSFLLCKKKQW